MSERSAGFGPNDDPLEKDRNGCAVFASLEGSDSVCEDIVVWGENSGRSAW